MSIKFCFVKKFLIRKIGYYCINKFGKKISVVFYKIANMATSIRMNYRYMSRVSSNLTYFRCQ